MKIALLEVSHWHFPLYETALLESGVEIVAVSDTDPSVRAHVAAIFGARSYETPEELLAGETSIDYAFAFGRHARQHAIGMALVERGIPFAMEKPGGLNGTQVRELRRAAGAKKLPVSVAFVQRVGPLFGALERLRKEEGADFRYSSWRFFAGPPGRYRAMGTPWMLEPAESGGGCLINLAPHWIDLTNLLHGQAEGAVLARTSAALHGEGVEDYALVSTRHPAGTAMVETGYCFPDHPQKREYSFSLSAAGLYVQSRADGINIFLSGAVEPEMLVFDLDSDPLYGVFVQRVLADHTAGRPPLAGLSDLEAVMGTVDAAYDAAQA